MLWAMVGAKVIGYFYFLDFGQYTIDYEQKTNKIIFLVTYLCKMVMNEVIG